MGSRGVSSVRGVMVMWGLGMWGQSVLEIQGFRWYMGLSGELLDYVGVGVYEGMYSLWV